MPATVAVAGVGSLGPVTPLPQESRPWQVSAAVLLLAPAALAWLAAAVGLYRLNAEQPMFAVPAAALLVAIGLVGVAGLWRVWQRQRPGCVTLLPTYAMFAIVVVTVLGYARSLLPGRRTHGVNPMHFEPTMLVPAVLAVLGLIALRLLRSQAAQAWFPTPGRPG
jgi:uncharacterized membrane protein